MKLIGQGVTSCVIQPPYPCDNKDIPKNSIAKILSNKKAVEEENKYKIIHSYDPKRIKSGKLVNENFIYSSENNKEWLTKINLAQWLRTYKKSIGKI